MKPPIAIPNMAPPDKVLFCILFCLADLLHGLGRCWGVRLVGADDLTSVDCISGDSVCVG